MIAFATKRKDPSALPAASLTIEGVQGNRWPVSLSPVLFVLPQSDASANGGISSIAQIIDRLEHYRPIIATNRLSPQTEQWQRCGIETHLLPMRPGGFLGDPAATVRSYWQCAIGLRRLIKSSNVRVVHANSPLALQLVLPAAKLGGARVALNLRGTMDPERRPLRSRYRLLFGAADHILFLSQDMADRWAQVAANAKRSFSVTYSIVDPAKFSASPPFSGEGPPVVLISAVVRPLKGQLEFIRHVSPLLAQNGIATWLAGDFDPGRDAYARACAKAAAPLGKMIRFLGYRDDIPELMRRAAVVAVASRHEGLARAMIEAMACARPVVSFDVSSAAEFLQDRSGGAGTVVNSGDHRQMAEAIIGYCRDRPMAAAAGAKGAASASRLFTPDAVVSRYERVYRGLLAEREAVSNAA